MSTKLILVIGATGAQGLAVSKALLAPAADGSPSPYGVRALTRDPTSKRAEELAALGAEIFKGAFDDLASVTAAFKGVYGAWVNTDGFTVGEEKETYAGLKIYEIAKRTPSLRHYVWSNLDYASKKAGYKPEYIAAHYDGKGRIADFLKAQPSVVSDKDLSWSVVTSGPYMDMLNIHIFGPLNQRADGTVVFAAPMGKGHAAMVSLKDLGWWARYTFDHREETSGKDLEIASDWVDWEYLVKTFSEVTGAKAVYVSQTLEEWWDNFFNVDKPVAAYLQDDPTAPTIRENFSAFWRLFRDDILTRDLDWIRSVHPGTQSLGEWMKENQYTGKMSNLLKGFEAGTTAFGPNHEKLSQL